ncbi:MAG: thiamine biosynthesis protein ThiS [Chloroflexi bacterium]|nr:thiamine biosynthesis protein ThiS [Chloroflexota bacterium]|tara:strand:- start:9957 stop:10160 length:204 start_codon:yes stop_codon:yes gene_type:complete
MVKVIVNGNTEKIPSRMTLDTYLEKIGFVGKYVAVAINGSVIERDTFGQVIFSDNDVVEIVRPVGGG